MSRQVVTAAIVLLVVAGAAPARAQGVDHGMPARPEAAQIGEDLAGLFPAPIEISDGSPARGPWHPFEVVEEGTQTAAEVAAWLGGTDGAARLAAWGWQRNAYRNYRMGPPGGTTDLTISIHEFGDASGALGALYAFADRWATLRRSTAERAGVVGPGVSGQAGSWKIGSEHEATLFAASDKWVIRVTATGPGDPPWAGAERVMDAVLARAGASLDP